MLKRNKSKHVGQGCFFALMLLACNSQLAVSQSTSRPVQSSTAQPVQPFQSAQQPAVQQPAAQQPAVQPQATQTPSGNLVPVQKPAMDDKPKEFDAEASYEFLKTICEIGPRISTTEGMMKQQKILKKHFEDLNATVEMQNFRATHPLARNTTTQLQNMIVSWHPDRRKRLMLCCHYDTRPFPDQDRKNPRGVFIGANDGGSGVALLMEMGKHMEQLPGKYGIDFVFFDAEEFVYDMRVDPMFVGSTYFARQYAAGQFQRRSFYKAPEPKIEYGILVDMVGDKHLEIGMEGNSLKQGARGQGGPGRLTQSIWGVANDLKVKEFKNKQLHLIRDDHLPLNDIARIPTCDIIDFDYPKPNKNVIGGTYWHTTRDTVENCSADSLGKVGKVLLEWIRRLEKL